MEGNNTTIVEDTSSFQSVQFVLLLIVEIPAIICTILIFIYFCQNFHTMIRKTLRDHGFLLLTALSFFYITLDLPFTINSFRLGEDEPRSPLFCRFWYWIDYSIVVSSAFLTATISVQRHILIFNAAYLNRTYFLLFLHYIPLILCLLYPSLFYFVLLYFYPCENYPDEYEYYCAYPCYSSNMILFNIDWVINMLVPVGGIVVFNFVLIFRVIRSLRKLRRGQPLMLRRQRKLTTQVVAIASLYAVGWGPSTVVAVLQQLFIPDLLERVPMLGYLNYISYFVCPLQPFLCLIMLPEIVTFIKNGIRRFLTRSVVAPENVNRRAY